MKKLNLLLLLGLFLTMQLKSQTDESANFTWSKVAVGGGGYVSGVVFSEAAQNIIYCRTDVGGAYRWNQSTGSWVQLLDGVSRAEVDLRCVESIAADPTNSGRVYIASGGSTGSSVGGIYWSTDQGTTLNYVNTPFKMAGNNSGRGIGERLQVDPNSPNILYYGSRVHGLYKSTDYAKTWTKVTSFPVSTTSDGGGLCFVVFDKTSSTSGTPTNTIYVAVSQNGNSLYKSTNAGSSWALVSGTPSSLQPHGAAITSGVMYLTYGSGPGPGTDGTGAVWKLNTATSAWTNITPSGSYGGFGGISIDKQSPSKLMVATAVNWGGGAIVFRSPDGGATWKNVSSNMAQTNGSAPYMGTGTGNWIESLKIDPFNSNRVMYVTGAGIWACSDATLNDANQTTHWDAAVKGIEEAGAYHILCPPSGTAKLFTNFGDIGGFRHTDITTSPSVSSWFGWCYGHGLDCAQNNPNIVVRNNGTSPYGYISTNNGASWTAFASQAVPGAGSNGEKIQISANGTSIVWSPENATPYYSKNSGSSWTACSGAPAGYNSMVSDKVNDSKFYYYNQSTGYVYVSTNGGANFTQAGYVATWGQRISANPKTEGDIWVPVYGQSANGVYHSTNSGASFTKLSNVQEASSVSLGATAPGKTYPTVYINGTINNQWGIYYSIDQGANWARINDDAHEYGWIDFVVADQQTFGRVYLSPNCMGVPYSTIKTTTNVAVTGVTMSPTTISVGVGSTTQLTATVAPSNATNKTVSWSSSNTSFATVNSSGLVTGVAAGLATITVTTQDGAKTATCAVTVTITSSGIVSGGTYELIARHSGKVIGIASASTTDGALATQQTYSSSTSQQFVVTDLGTGYYRISPASGTAKALDVNGNSTADGANIIQWTYGGGNNQQWQLVSLTGGYYQIISRSSGKCMDVNGASTADGASIIQWTCGTGNNQQWTFSRLKSAAVSTEIKNSNNDIYDINLYPNPSNGKLLNIELTGLEGLTSIMIFSLNGQLMKQQSVVDQQLVQLELSLTPGIYTIQFVNSQKTIVKKFVVQ